MIEIDSQRKAFISFLFLIFSPQDPLFSLPFFFRHVHKYLQYLQIIGAMDFLKKKLLS